MIKSFNGASDSYAKKTDPVPVGSYVGMIKAASVEKTKFGTDVLLLEFDITEGEQAGYYAKRLAADRADNPEAKTKGVYRLNLPVGDGSEKDGWAINKFNKMLGSVAASNAGFKWAWDEKTLVGKTVGFVYRDREWEFEGRTGFTTEVGMLCSADDARKNKIQLKPRLLANKPAPALAGFAATNEEVPF